MENLATSLGMLLALLAIPTAGGEPAKKPRKRRPRPPAEPHGPA